MIRRTFSRPVPLDPCNERNTGHHCDRHQPTHTLRLVLFVGINLNDSDGINVNDACIFNNICGNLYERNSRHSLN